MSELITNEQLAEREAAKVHDLCRMGDCPRCDCYRAILAFQEPSLLARLREAERLLDSTRRHLKQLPCVNGECLCCEVEVYFARVNAALPQEEQA